MTTTHGGIGKVQRQEDRSGKSSHGTLGMAGHPSSPIDAIHEAVDHRLGSVRRGPELSVCVDLLSDCGSSLAPTTRQNRNPCFLKHS